MLHDAPVYSDTMLLHIFEVNDIKAAKKFYSETLGIDVKEVSETALDLEVRSDVKISIVEKTDYDAPDYAILNFIVNDIDAVVDELSSKDVIFERYEHVASPQDKKNIARAQNSDQVDTAWFKDPSGNVHALVQKSKLSPIVLPPKPNFLNP